MAKVAHAMVLHPSWILQNLRQSRNWQRWYISRKLRWTQEFMTELLPAHAGLTFNNHFRNINNGTYLCNNKTQIQFGILFIFDTILSAMTMNSSEAFLLKIQINIRYIYMRVYADHIMILLQCVFHLQRNC